MQAAAKSAPDGHTLVIVDTGTMAQSPYLYLRAGYDPLADFIPVTRLVDSALMMAVHPEVPARSVAELIQPARATPGKISYGPSGIGTPPHLAGELFNSMAGIGVVHVSYKGTAPALRDLLAGRIAYTIDSLSMQAQSVEAGKLRALAMTGTSRSAAAPDVPTLIESGAGGLRVPFMDGGRRACRHVEGNRDAPQPGAGPGVAPARGEGLVRRPGRRCRGRRSGRVRRSRAGRSGSMEQGNSRGGHYRGAAACLGGTLLCFLCPAIDELRLYKGGDAYATFGRSSVWMRSSAFPSSRFAI